MSGKLYITLFISGTAAVLVFIAFMASEQNKRGYAAWEKLTGNPQHLAYEEWFDLKCSLGSERSTVIIPIHH